jgi:DNA-binding Lrp family transcriptional regulator
MKKRCTFDDIDKQIIAELQRDGRIGLVELGKKIKLSHPGAGNRLKKLLAEDLVKVRADLNLRKLGMHLVALGIEVDGVDRAMEFAKKFSLCPRTAFIAPMTGDYNLFMILVCEEIRCLQHLIEKTIRPLGGVKRLSISFSSTPFEPTYLPIKIPVEKGEIAPCEKNCGKCEIFRAGLCIGCPATTNYRGRL